LGSLPPSVDNPELPACSTAVRAKGRENWLHIATGSAPDGSHLVSLPFRWDGANLSIEPLSPTPELQEQDLHLFDAPATPAKPPGNGTVIDGVWRWDFKPSGAALGAYGVDVFLAAGPWAPMLALFLAPGRNMADLGAALFLAALSTAATLVLATVQAVLFIRRGRTLGMACVGLVAVTGSRGLGLFFGAIFVVIPMGLAALGAAAMGGD